MSDSQKYPFVKALSSTIQAQNEDREEVKGGRCLAM